MMKKIIAAFSQKKVLNEEAFTRHFMDVAQRENPELSFDVTGDLAIVITNEAREVGSLFLDNAYREYVNLPDDFQGIIDKYIHAIHAVTAEEDASVVKPECILPVVKNQAFIDYAVEAGKDEPLENQLYFEAENAEMRVLYVEDRDDAMRFLKREDIQQLGMEASELRELTVDNFKQHLSEIEVHGEVDVVSMLVLDGTYEASLLLVDELWTKERFPVEGDIVVFVPARDMVVVTGSESQQGLESAYNVINNNEFSHLALDKPLIRRDGQWQVFEATTERADN